MRALAMATTIAWLAGCQAFQSAFSRDRADGGVAERANRSARGKDFGFAWDEGLPAPKRASGGVANDRNDEKLAASAAAPRKGAGDARKAGDSALDAVADRGAGPNASSAMATPLGGNASAAKYTAFRDRLDALGATWSSEKSNDGRRTLVRCEVPFPGDAAHARVFESSSGDELAALAAAVTQAERWHATAKSATAGKNLAEPPAP